MSKPKWNPRMKPRIVVVFYAMVLFVGYLAYNLVQVQARQNPRLKEVALNQHVGTIPLPALRGAIMDRNKQILAASLSLPSIAANPQEARKDKDMERNVGYLSRTLGVPVKEIRSLLNARGTFVWLSRKVDEKTAQSVEKSKLKGVFVLREPTGKRFYPKGRLGVHILGYTGIDDNGLDGIEGVFDPSLSGTPGLLEAEMDRDGRLIPYGWSKIQPAQPGNNIVLTIDEPIQYIVEKELDAAMKRHKPKGITCIVMDVKTGDILAIANKPDYSTRDFSKVPTSLRRNRAVADAYEPGSTFKVFLAAAALDSGSATVNQPFYCGDSITVDGWQIRNANDGLNAGGSETLKDIITFSFNTGTVAVALPLGKKKFFDYICKFGFGEQTGIALPGETEGIVQPISGWANVTLATNSFGQGIAVTPIQLVNAMQAIANKGVMMKPRLVKEIVDPDGKVIRAIPPTVRRRVISEETSYDMREILRNVVEKGTGKKAEVPGYPSAGKTGTANVVDNGIYVGGRYVASFLGFAPVHDPRIVVLVKVEEPQGIYWGGFVAGPIFRGIARETLWRLGVQPTMLQATSKETE